MAKFTKRFLPKDEKEALIFAGEAFRVDLQGEIHRLMQERGISRKELAKKIGVRASRIKRIFEDDCNVRPRLLGKVFHALGVKPNLSFIPIVQLDNNAESE